MKIQYAHEMHKCDALQYSEALYSKKQASAYLLSYNTVKIPIPSMSDEFCWTSVLVKKFADGSVCDHSGLIVALSEEEWLEEYENRLENLDYESAMRMEQPDYWPGMEGDKG